MERILMNIYKIAELAGVSDATYIRKIIELVQLKLNIKRFYAVKYAMNFGGGLYPHRSRYKEPPLIEVGGLMN